MNIYLIGILCIVGLIISQGSTANGSPKKDKHPTQKEIYKPITPKEINNGTSDKPQSIADIFLINNPKVPLWIVNPLYYIVEKFVQIMGYLLEDDDTLELNLPKDYYDNSI
ncbi:unnamed protein product [Schistosoma rodhaini]|uniref:Uncharacterized protein n=1 Tax=Schistosoma rodhaini TaxID=6188 RepID=A0AA85FAX0_9TREM|nr:unnamed protein product [Schistosoma rodhaini]